MATKTKLPKLSRSEKALQMFRTGKIATRTEDGYWLVPGHNGNEYEVREMPGTFLCSCPDATYRGHGGSATDLCKHAQFIILLRESEKRRDDEVIAKKQEELSAHLDVHLKRNRVVVF